MPKGRRHATANCQLAAVRSLVFVSSRPTVPFPPYRTLSMDTADILVRRGLLKDWQLAEVKQAQTNGVRLDQVAVELGYRSEEAVLRAVGAEVGLDFIDLSETPVDFTL